MSKFIYLISLIAFITGNALAQTGALTGYVRDQNTGQALTGATIVIAGTNLGAVADLNGYYEITGIPGKTYVITASFIGYKQLSKYSVVIRSAGNPMLNFYLSQTSETLEDVVIKANPFDKLPETPLSIQSLSAEEIATYPGGNNDIAKVVQSLPGVSGSVGGFRNDVIIRGGAPNENVYYLDGMEIPNINHFSTQGSAGGPVGLLNVSFIEGVTLSTSAFNAKYDNPLSGVLQFDQRIGNPKEFQGNLRVSASETALTLEGPVFKAGNEIGKTTYLVSARRSYLQFLFKVIGLPILPDYWDYQYKIHHKIDDYNEVSFLGIGAVDDFSINVPDDIDAEQQATLDQVPVIKQWTTTAGINWKRRFKKGDGYMNTILSTNILDNNFSQFNNNENQTGLYFSNNSRESEIKLRYEQTRFFEDWTVTGGLTLQRVGYNNNTLNLVDNITYQSDIDFTKYGFFIQTTRSLLDNKMNISLGIRSDANSLTTQNDQLIATLSPRVAVSYALDQDQRWNLNASLGRYYKIPPYTILGFRDNTGRLINQSASYIRSDHAVIGVEHLLNESTRITLEGFYKKYNDYPVSSLDGISLANKGGDFEVLGNEAIQSTGKGETYGMEFLYQQKYTKHFYGILAYTFFVSEFSGTDNRLLPSLWDSRHLLTFTGGYKLGNNWEVSLRYRFVGKTPFVPVDQEATLQFYPAVILDYAQLGENRLSSFNQADVRIDKKWNFNKLTLDVYLEIQNAFNQSVPEPPDFGLDRDPSGAIIEPRSLVEIEDDNASILPIIGLVLNF